MNNTWMMAMEGCKRLSPGMKGTKRHLQQFGDQLLYVRYRHDPVRQLYLTTVELIVDEAPLLLPHSDTAKRLLPPHNQYALVRINYRETELRRQAKAAGAKWQVEERAWRLPYHNVIGLGLEQRIIESGVVDTAIW